MDYVHNPVFLIENILYIILIKFVKNYEFFNKMDTI